MNINILKNSPIFTNNETANEYYKNQYIIFFSFCAFLFFNEHHNPEYVQILDNNCVVQNNADTLLSNCTMSVCFPCFFLFLLTLPSKFALESPPW